MKPELLLDGKNSDFFSVTSIYILPMMVFFSGKKNVIGNTGVAYSIRYCLL